MADATSFPETSAEVGYTTIVMTQSVMIPLADGEDRTAKQNEALRSFYQLVSRTCATVRETIADTCEITTITFNLRSNEKQAPNRPDKQDTIRVDGNIQMLVRLKPDVGPPSPENSRRQPRPLGNRY